MRPIDADALTEDCKRYLGTLNPDRDGKECTRIHWLIGVLANASTIEPERKTGKWISLEVAPFANNDGQLIYEKMCNQCGTIAYFRSVGNGCIGNNFCPNCGSDMRQEGEDDGKAD